MKASANPGDTGTATLTAETGNANISSNNGNKEAIRWTDVTKMASLGAFVEEAFGGFTGLGYAGGEGTLTDM